MSICLSVASNLRCSNLSLPQAQALLALPAVDIVFCAGIIKLDWGKIKHHQWAIIVEAIVYFCLTLFDYLEHAKAKDGLDLATFATYDKAIGVLTMFPLFFYCAALLLLARIDILPLTTSRPYNRLIQFTLVATTPLILLFNELAGLLGITYQFLGGQIYLGFVDRRADMVASALTGTTLVFLAYFQFVLGIACIFYIFRARSRGHGGGVITGFTCCGSGLLLGTLETLLGFGHQGFPLTLTRKIFRTTARALLISGMIAGTSVEEGFALYPSRPRRAMIEARGSTGLRALISNPRASTFAHLSPRATAFHHNHSASRLHGLARSDSSSSTNHLMADPHQPIENIPPSRRQAPVENIAVSREQELSPGLVLGVPTSVTDRLIRKQKRRQTDGIYFSYASPSLGGAGTANIRPGFNAFDPKEMAKLPVRANKPGDRVTIHFPDGDYTKAPVLELRLSDLQLPSPRAVAAGLRTPDGSSVTANHSHATRALEDDSAIGGEYAAAVARRKLGLPPRPREISFSEETGPRKTPREMGVRLPSRPLSARLSRRWSSFTGSRSSPGGSWRALPDDHDEPTDLPLEPPQPTFVAQASEGRSATPRSSRSRISESESIWLKGGTLAPVASSGEQRSSQQRSTWNSEEWDTGTPGTPKFAAKIVEARAVSVRPHWSTAYIYHPRLPTEEDPSSATGPSSNVPFPIAPSPLNQLANHAHEREAQFEADFQTGLTRQIYASERRVSRAVGGSSTEQGDNAYGNDTSLEEALVARPRLSDRAADVENRRRSLKRSQSGSDESQDVLKRMSHRFKSLQSAEDGATTVGHSVGSTDEVRSLVRGFGTVVSRRPTVLSNSGERESVTLEHGQATPSTSLNTLQQVFGQRYSFEAHPTIPESQVEVESSGGGPMGRTDSGIFGRDNSF